MLTLQLTNSDNRQIAVYANGQESHFFSLLELGQSEKEWKEFFKDPRPYGGKLFQALFKDDSSARGAFDELSKQSERTIVLVFESSELDGIAWEYAYHDNAYIVEDFAFIRALPDKERPHSNGRMTKSVERLPLLFIPANPLVDLSGEPMRELDIESEWREITQHIVRSNAPFDLIELRPATPAALQSMMARFQNGMIAHFSGHGAATKDGAFLLFENENGSSNPLEAREFVREVKDQAWISFLSACQSAVAERTEYSNLARELVKAGVPFALGMQFNFPDPFAPNISGQFYNYLSQGHAIPEAARQARRAVKRENEFYVGMIALYAAHPDEAGKIGWTGSGARTLSTFVAANVGDLPTPSGFIGRQRELMNIGTSLLETKKPNTVTLHGAGGIGKTALMRQALLRFAPSFESALAIALDPLPSLESVLGRLERFLSLPSPCSNETKERERIVRERLTSSRTLLGLDNFETLNYALNEKGSDEEKTAKSLHSFFEYLTTNGVTLCVTSREVTNLGGEHIEEIYGLTNESGGRLFQENVVRQKNELYVEKSQKVSEMVGGHPLALRLLASAYDDNVGMSVEQFVEDLQSFLPKARDKWTEENRHESLRASFDFTMNNLLKAENGRNLQSALAKLSIFLAPFVDLTASPVLEEKLFESESDEESTKSITRASNTLRELWEHGLLERAFTIRSQKDVVYLYRLHPVLRDFAKEHLTNVETLQENYWKSMNFLATVAHKNIPLDPFIAHIAFNSLPDLLFAVGLKNDEDTVLMQFCVSQVLRHFGLFDDSLHLLEKAREKNESLNDLQTKSLILSAMAYILAARGNQDDAMKLLAQSGQIPEEFVDMRVKAANLKEMAYILGERGNLDEAMDLYQQSQVIFERLSDMGGKSVALHGMADIYLARGKLDEAMNLYQQSLDIKEGLRDLKGKATTLRAIANILQVRGELDDAIKLYQLSLENSEDINDLAGKFDSLHQLANIYLSRGELNEALKLYQWALEITEALGNVRNKAAILFGIAYILGEHGDLERAMNLYEQSLEIAERLGDLDSKSATLESMAYIERKRGNLDGAVKLYQQSLKISDELGDQKGKSSTLLALARIYEQSGELNKALRLYLQITEVYEGLGELRLLAIAKGELSKIYVTYGDLEKSLSLLDEKLQIVRKLGDKREESQGLREQAEIYRKLGDVDSATRLLKQALEAVDGLDNLQGKASMLQSMASICILRNELDEAMELCQQALEIDEELGDSFSKGATFNQMAGILALQRDFPNAMKYYKQALDTFEELGYLKEKAATLNQIAYVLVNSDDLNGAMNLYEHVLEIREGLGDILGISVTLHEMANAKLLQGDLAEAIKLYQKALDIHEKLGNRHGKAVTLASMGKALWASDSHGKAIAHLMSSLMMLVQSKIELHTQQAIVAELIEWRQELGAEKFDRLWQEEVGLSVPEWLTQKAKQDMTTEQFIAAAIQSAREKRPEAEEYFKAAQKMAIDSNTPAELQSLGKVLQRIMIGQKNVDLSALTDELREIVEKAL